MIDWILGWVSPHICEGCSETGKTLCERCKINILQQKWEKCVRCECEVTFSELAKYGNVCCGCAKELPFHKVFVVGKRTAILKKLVGNYKYFSRRESAVAIADLMDSVLPKKLPDDFVVVSIPTIPKHIRERGFDHMKLVVRQLSRKRNLQCNLNLLLRNDNISQHTANLKQRQKQAQQAFSVNPRCSIPSKILLIDDIYTTGATLIATTELLQKYGVKKIWIGVVARQTKSS